MRISNGVKENTYTSKSFELNSVDNLKANQNNNAIKQEIKQEDSLILKEDQVKPVVNQDTNEREIIDAIEKSNKHIKIYNRRLEFSIHDETKQIMVKVIDTEDGSVIREIPSEKILDMVAHLWEVAGILVDEKR